ncbi:Os09g0282701, partial [Oryza sativa Japonica Group]
IPNVAADAFPAAIGVDPNMSGDCDVLSPDGFSQVFDNSWYRNSSGSTLTISPSSNCYSVQLQCLYLSFLRAKDNL